jgi:hypothetical protein
MVDFHVVGALFIDSWNRAEESALGYLKFAYMYIVFHHSKTPLVKNRSH